MKKISRRELIYSTACTLMSSTAVCPALSFWDKKKDDKKDNRSIRGKIFKGDAPDKIWKWSKEAFMYKKLDNKRVLCRICPNSCILSPGDRSVCRSKVNADGKLISLAYGNPCAVHVDPVEKKPLYHFRPKSRVFSIAAAGCNFRCLNCQNWSISQVRPMDVRTYDMFPDKVVKETVKSGSFSIAYTYSEPTTFFEYMYDTAKIARGEKIDNILVSNGYINQKPLEKLCTVLNGANVNLKAYSNDIYKKLNGGTLKPVLNTFKTLHEKGVHFEMTNLVVPGYVDNAEMVKQMCGWILKNLGPDYPLHFTRFFPQYKLTRLAPTPVSTISSFRDLAMKEGIHYVYVGNVAGHKGSNTYCHNCKKMLIERRGYNIPRIHISEGKCEFCKTIIPGVWS